jgi:hypothetical protein
VRLPVRRSTTVARLTIPVVWLVVVTRVVVTPAVSRRYQYRPLEPEPQGDLPRRAKGRSEPRELRITDADAIGSGLRPAKGIDDRSNPYPNRAFPAFASRTPSS